MYFSDYYLIFPINDCLWYREVGSDSFCDITPSTKVKNFYPPKIFPAGPKQISPYFSPDWFLVGMFSWFTCAYWPNCSQQFLL